MENDVGLPTGTPLAILVVEDHADTAELMRLLLSREGHRVRVAGTLAQAQSACVHDRFDVILCDIGLPDGSGTVLARQVRAACPSTRLIALTGHAMPNELARVDAAGFDGTLIKPLHVPELLVLLSSLPKLKATVLQPPPSLSA